MLTNKIAATGMMLAIIGGVFAQQKAAVPATAKTTPATAVAKTDTAKKQPATPAKPAATKQTPATAVAKTDTAKKQPAAPAKPATTKQTPATAVAKTDTAKKQPATPAKPAATKQTPATAVAKTDTAKKQPAAPATATAKTTPATAAAHSDTAKKQPPAPATPAAKVKQKMLKGKVDAVDVAANTITVKVKGNVRSFQLSPDTKFTKGGKNVPVTLKEIGKGATVKITHSGETVSEVHLSVQLPAAAKSATDTAKAAQ